VFFQNRSDYFFVLPLVRPVLEFAAPAWNPYLSKDKLALEEIQRRASRLALGQKRGEMENEDRLRKLMWPTLETRRLFLSLVECNKIVFGINKLNFDDLFEFRYQVQFNPR